MRTSPFQVMFGREVSTLCPLVENPDKDGNPIADGEAREEVMKLVREAQDAAIQKMKQRFDTTNTIVCSLFSD
jgi:hypothetical protein